MSPRHFLVFLATVVALVAQPQPTQQELVTRAGDQYRQRVEEASKALSSARKHVADEKTPLVKAIRELEGRIIALEGEITRMETDQQEVENDRKRLFKERDGINRTLTYLATLGSEAIKLKGDSLVPGERTLLGEPLAHAQQKLETADAAVNARGFVDAAELLLGQALHSLGGYVSPGKALRENEVLEGRFAFVGPESFFLSDDNSFVGSLRTREGTVLPVALPLPASHGAKAKPYFSGQAGILPLDASGGKALQLRALQGTMLDEIRKGGLVGYLIVGIGLLAVIIAIMKLVDLARLSVDDPAKIRPLVLRLAGGDTGAVAAAIPTLKRTTQELFQTGLAHFNKPKELLEEHLLSFVMRQRLHFERRLPLLAVIVTAAPLMGLLGTVTGMVKTFTLITVFGTGSATRLSSGISEALVTTMLGLVVAIPVLIIHGFLSHRIHKSLALVERFAHEFAVAAEDAKLRKATGQEVVT